MNSPENHPWTKQSITIYLSPDRRGKLADYASCTTRQMTPAETIYALIDTASGRDIEEDVSHAQVKNQIAALHAHMKEQEKTIKECHQVLQAVNQVLASVNDLIQNLALAEKDD
ncbi:hypothetical protein EJD96_16175 [Herbaspirillum seropedicae]|uniref:hypothetical protein n=1 Tax=Herbaspirillum seropedicae TaxID=964 RepID=UPI00112346BA|nr:hypothetical protein [Herbaspirillum seropedicae]QDD65586.1 hypothetical protein EJD96_16175 [Herbaspirillum seropedicae]